LVKTATATRSDILHAANQDLDDTTMSKDTKQGGLDLKEIVAIVKKRRWLVVAPIILVTGIAYLITHFLEPSYESSTIIWIDKPSNVSKELTSIIGTEQMDRGNREDRARQLLALQNEIVSQTYLFQLIRDLQLDNDPEITREAAKMREKNPEFSLEQLKFNVLLQELRKSIKVDFAGADQILIAISANDGQKARDRVARLTEIFQSEKSKYELNRVLDNQSFADEQLSKKGYDYQQALDSLSLAQSRLAKLQLPENISSEANRRDILSDIDKSDLDIADYTRELEGLSARMSDFGLTTARLKFSDSLIDLRTEIDGQVGTFAMLMEKYAWNEQNVTNINFRLNANIRLLEQEISNAVDRQFASYPDNQRKLLARQYIVTENIDILNSRVSQMQSSLRKIDERVNRIPRMEAEVEELSRRVEEARKYRDAFKSEEATVEILSERIKDRTKYKVIEPARVPLTPVSPDKVKITVMGFMLSLVLGGATVLLVEILDNSFKRVEDIEAMLGLKVLATIPKIEQLGGRG
jgi:polysaccharide biosynthesis transport protein